MQVFSFALICDLCPLEMWYLISCDYPKFTSFFALSLGLIITPGQWISGQVVQARHRIELTERACETLYWDKATFS